MTADPNIKSKVPHVIGKVQYADRVDCDGVPFPVKGVKLKGNKGGKVYYLNETMDGFQTDSTSSNGRFIIIVSNALGERWEAYRGDNKVTHFTAVLGKATGVTFSITMPVFAEADPDAPSGNSCQ